MIQQRLTSPREISTDRLRLAPLTPADIDALYAVQSDPRTWRHLPSGRATSRAVSELAVQDAIGSRLRFGLGPWAIRLANADAVPGQPAGAFVGSGGVGMTDGGVWNLGYRLDPAAWGRGLATELAHAAVDAAHAEHPEVAVTGRVLTNNTASAAVLRRVGLSLAWQGTTAEPAPSGVERQVWSDRALAADELDWLVAHA